MFNESLKCVCTKVSFNIAEKYAKQVVKEYIRKVTEKEHINHYIITIRLTRNNRVFSVVK